ncbi:hypothetical protein N7452_000133 [Penicillium brevicompactum]|uniref:Sec39 domain-containing protein n=1 Tax=Penicillium brevicompactum TaxID=5074 RepID=A0A9W9UNS8_PENBR|nr:hypothetical protein N7452_000133 [Penicillium brevicompactum]
MAFELSDAHAILLATNLCAGGSVAELPALQAQFLHCFPFERLLRIILTFLPESTEPSSYTSVLQELQAGPSEPTDQAIDTSAVKDLTEAAARKRVRKLNLRPLQRPDEEAEVASADPLTQFLIHRAHLIDSETALQPLVLELLLPFYERSQVIRTWLISSLLPLLRLNYELYANREENISFEVLESMDDQTAINILLSLISDQENSMDLVNNLKGLIGPWLYGGNRSKRRRLNEAAQQNSVSFIQGSEKPQSTELAGWEHVNEWLVSRSLVDHESVVSAFRHWNGPSDVDLGGYEKPGEGLSDDKAIELQSRYGQSGLAVVFAHADSSPAVLDGSFEILNRVAKLLDLEDSLYPSTDSGLHSVHYDTEPVSSTSRASLLQNSLLRPTNPLTKPSPSSISFLSALLISLQILTELGHLVPCRVAANMCLHSTQEMQLAELKSAVESTVKQPRSPQDWPMVRQKLLWLRDWQAEEPESAWDEPSSPYHGLFWRVPRETVETEILKALLAAKEYQLAVDLYTNPKSAPLSSSQVEAAVQEAIFAAYDNASNGNRTRGGMKRAYDILQSFQPHFPESLALKQVRALIAATHALSYYSLTLQHGVPFQPVSIRVHHDPLLLIEKVLEQNARSYTKLDDLLSIGRNLVAAGVPTKSATHESDDEPSDPPSEEQALLTSERRITSLAINSALNSNDFGTAYSYIQTRLSPPSLLSTPSLTSTTPDDISWRAVYSAGRYRSTTPTNPPPSLTTQITHLSQRMELLSLALVLTPSPEPLPEVLGAWRRCDEELTSLRAREQQEEDLWDRKGDTLSSVPGGFGPSDSERDAFDTEQQRAARRARARAALPNSHRHEAPMGLFEVARGAALAIHKNAFPLRGKEEVSISDERPLSPDSEGRVRKRDMVSNMVTGGLVSGIGWVIGAPANK